MLKEATFLKLGVVVREMLEGLGGGAQGGGFRTSTGGGGGTGFELGDWLFETNIEGKSRCWSGVLGW